MAIVGYPKTLTWANFGLPKNTVPSSYGGTHTDCHIEIDIDATFKTTKDPTVSDFILKNGKVTVKINSLETWVLKGLSKSANQAAVLKQEQGHSNIAGLTPKDSENPLN